MLTRYSKLLLSSQLHTPCGRQRNQSSECQPGSQSEGGGPCDTPNNRQAETRQSGESHLLRSTLAFPLGPSQVGRSVSNLPVWGGVCRQCFPTKSVTLLLLSNDQ